MTIDYLRNVFLFNFLTHLPSTVCDLEFVRSWKYIASFERSLSQNSLIGFLLYENGLLDLLRHFGCVQVAKIVIYVCSDSQLHTKQKSTIQLHILVAPREAAKNIGYERKLLRVSAVALISYFVFIVRWNGSEALSRDVVMWTETKWC